MLMPCPPKVLIIILHNTETVEVFCEMLFTTLAYASAATVDIFFNLLMHILPGILYTNNNL